MSVLANQTGINTSKDFYIRTAGGSDVTYNKDILFTTTTNASSEYQSTARITGGNGGLFIQDDSFVNFSMPFSGLPQVQINIDANYQNNLTALYVSSFIGTNGGLRIDNLAPNALAMSITNRDNVNNLAGAWGLGNAQSTIGGYQASTLQLYSEFPTGNQVEVVEIDPTTERITIINYSTIMANLICSNINGAAQQPSATRSGFFTQVAGGSGTTPVANSAVGASTIIHVAPWGSPNANSNAYTFSVNPVAGIGFASIANAPLSNAQTMAYYVLQW